MTAEQWLKVGEVVVSFLGALIWPGVLVYILLHFGPDLKRFLSSAGKVSVKGPGFEVTAEKQIEAAAALTAAALNKPADPNQQIGPEQLRNITETVAGATSIAAKRQSAAPSILWVDDRPINNVYERQALEALGMRITISLSTEDALEKVQLNNFDVIISDMGRPPDRRAGYTLLDQLRARHIKTPFIIYAGSNAVEHKREAQQHGAQGSTNNAQELIQLVVDAIQRNSPS